ncbi:MAG: DUF3142 domain-containing protein [Sphingopyxis sp.]
MTDRRHFMLGGAAALAGLASGCGSNALMDPTVNAANYDAFWLWAGVRPQSVLDTARTIYILALEMRRASDGAQWIDQRASLPHIAHADIWMAVRTNTLAWSRQQVAAVIAELDRWRAAGNRLRGLQVDFDAATQALGGYAHFLQNIRAALPRHYALSVTGLLDWASHGDMAEVGALAHIVDEVVIQTYQGRQTVVDAERYLARMGRISMPFRIGLVQGGRMPDLAAAERLANFRGHVVFLLNEALT